MVQLVRGVSQSPCTRTTSRGGPFCMPPSNWAIGHHRPSLLLSSHHGTLRHQPSHACSDRSLAANQAPAGHWSIKQSSVNGVSQAGDLNRSGLWLLRQEHVVVHGLSSLKGTWRSIHGSIHPSSCIMSCNLQQAAGEQGICSTWWIDQPTLWMKRKYCIYNNVQVACLLTPSLYIVWTTGHLILRGRGEPHIMMMIREVVKFYFIFFGRTVGAGGVK